MTLWKSKIGVVMSTESESEESEHSHFLPTPSLLIQWKLNCRSWKKKRKNQPITMLGIEYFHWFILPLLLPSFHWIVSDGVITGIGILLPIFTRSYRSALLITTPTPSLVKTNNSEAILYKNGSFKLQKESNGMGLKRVAPESMLTLWLQGVIRM